MFLPSSFTQAPPPFPLSSSWQPLAMDQFPVCTVPDQKELERLSGILDPVDPLEVIHVYGPWVEHLCQRFKPQLRTSPLLVGMTGSVCSGKTTAARVLHYLFAQRFGEEKTTLLTLDNFLKPNAEIERCPGGMACKGFPETFRFDKLLEALTAITHGKPVRIPCYDHMHYDIYEHQSRQIPGQQQVVIVEGIIAAQNTPSVGNAFGGEHIRDFCQTMVFVQTLDDAVVLPQWFEERLVLFAKTVRRQRKGHLAQRYAIQLKQFDCDLANGLPPRRAQQRFEQAIRMDARRIWATTNGPNYAQFIAPSRRHCDTVLLKKADHHIGGVYTRTP